MKKIFTIIFIIFSIFYFYKIGETNYEKQKEIKKFIVSKPDFLPDKKSAANTSFGFKNLKSDYYWLQTIQYIGGNALSSSYKSYLFLMIDLVTELNPYFSEPYVIGELLLPSYNPRYENLSEKKQEELKNQAIEIGLKGVKNLCDLEKISKIEKETNLEKLFTEEKYKNPCKNSDVVYNLAFVYYFYKKDFKNAVKYYKVASVTKGSPEGAKNLISILEGKGGNREKSFFMFLNMANYSSKGNEVCLEFSNILQNIGERIFYDKIKINGNFLKDLEKTRKENIFEDGNGLSASSCGNFLNKSIRELNLYYLEEANKKYKEKFEKNSETPKDLLKNGFIDYIPVDYQQEENYGIIYFYNNEIGVYDYKMGKY
ncbi:hypothetical protein DLH72_00905 [Candidatus Gracilibacteria bacterium]|nr:MAG: hypothetical protein DLH72_00905 [Candidatus Gracilibacteria bacterium]